MAGLHQGARWVTNQHFQKQCLQGGQRRRPRLTPSRMTCKRSDGRDFPGQQLTSNCYDCQDSQSKGIDRTTDAHARPTLSPSRSGQAATVQVRVSGPSAPNLLSLSPPLPVSIYAFSTRLFPLLSRAHLSQYCRRRISICLSPSPWPFSRPPGPGFPISFSQFSSTSISQVRAGVPLDSSHHVQPGGLLVQNPEHTQQRTKDVARVCTLPAAHYLRTTGADVDSGVAGISPFSRGRWGVTRPMLVVSFLLLIT
ncbi:hypothetical protein F5883DRAFT_261995 [Diaporthe sp. PMI_573]|jgi:hypothetical protein|nr:hypothetical protein F5883DRAFT_261995 [Diaporthaceae sp. PMI_573]